MRSLAYCALLLSLFGDAAAIGKDCCDRCDECGCACPCRKVCRLVCETKKVPKVTFSCKCEDFCVPGPSDRCVTCDDCGKRKVVYTPRCAEVRTRKVLVKHETMEEKPSYKWVVETICDGCCSKCAADEIKPAPPEATVQKSPVDILKATFRSPIAGPLFSEPRTP